MPDGFERPFLLLLNKKMMPANIVGVHEAKMSSRCYKAICKNYRVKALL